MDQVQILPSSQPTLSPQFRNLQLEIPPYRGGSVPGERVGRLQSSSPGPSGVSHLPSQKLPSMRDAAPITSSASPSSRNNSSSKMALPHLTPATSVSGSSTSSPPSKRLNLHQSGTSQRKDFHDPMPISPSVSISTSDSTPSSASTVWSDYSFFHPAPICSNSGVVNGTVADDRNQYGPSPVYVGRGRKGNSDMTFAEMVKEEESRVMRLQDFEAATAVAGLDGAMNVGRALDRRHRQTTSGGSAGRETGAFRKLEHLRMSSGTSNSIYTPLTPFTPPSSESLDNGKGKQRIDEVSSTNAITSPSLPANAPRPRPKHSMSFYSPRTQNMSLSSLSPFPSPRLPDAFSNAPSPHLPTTPGVVSPIEQPPGLAFPFPNQFGPEEEEGTLVPPHPRPSPTPFYFDTPLSSGVSEEHLQKKSRRHAEQELEVEQQQRRKEKSEKQTKKQPHTQSKQERGLLDLHSIIHDTDYSRRSLAELLPVGIYSFSNEEPVFPGGKRKRNRHLSTHAAAPPPNAPGGPSLVPPTAHHANLIGCILETGGSGNNMKLKFENILGLGAYGVVYLATEMFTAPSIDGKKTKRSTLASSVDHPPPRQFAVKTLSKLSLDPRQRSFQTREIALHTLCSSHPNIVSLVAVHETANCIFVVLELIKGGDLFEVITGAAGLVEADEDYHHSDYGYDGDEDEEPMSGRDRQITSLFLQILGGVEHCHKMGVYHRDLKPENILIRDVQREAEMEVVVEDRGHLRKLRVMRPHVKREAVIADFGLATMESLSGDFGCGSSFYISPECQGAFPDEQGSRAQLPPYSTAHNDIWSLGVILVNLTCSRNPWKQATLSDETFRAFLRDEDFLRNILPVSSPCNEILKRIFAIDPRGRPSLSELREMVLNVQHWNMTPWELRVATPATREAARAIFGDYILEEADADWDEDWDEQGEDYFSPQSLNQPRRNSRDSDMKSAWTTYTGTMDKTAVPSPDELPEQPNSLEPEGLDMEEETGSALVTPPAGQSRSLPQKHQTSGIFPQHPTYAAFSEFQFPPSSHSHPNPSDLSAWINLPGDGPAPWQIINDGNALEIPNVGTESVTQDRRMSHSSAGSSSFSSYRTSQTSSCTSCDEDWPSSSSAARPCSEYAGFPFLGFGDSATQMVVNDGMAPDHHQGQEVVTQDGNRFVLVDAHSLHPTLHRFSSKHHRKDNQGSSLSSSSSSGFVPPSSTTTAGNDENLGRRRSKRTSSSTGSKSVPHLPSNLNPAFAVPPRSQSDSNQHG